VLLTARFVAAEKLESYVAADAAARAGRLADEIPAEFTIPTAADPSLAPAGRHLVSVLLRPVPLLPPKGWAVLKPALVEKVLGMLRHHLPDLARHVVETDVTTPDDILVRSGPADAAAGVTHLLADWVTRLGTPVEGLMLCGAAAEPVPAISGRAARLAVEKIMRDAKR
jgi:phytoene dehydrogenase-like protein